MKLSTFLENSAIRKAREEYETACQALGWARGRGDGEIYAGAGNEHGDYEQFSGPNDSDGGFKLTQEEHDAIAKIVVGAFRRRVEEAESALRELGIDIDMTAEQGIDRHFADKDEDEDEDQDEAA